MHTKLYRHPKRTVSIVYTCMTNYEIAVCCGLLLGAVLEAAERKLSSWPAAVQSNPTLAGILSVLQSSLSRNS